MGNAPLPPLPPAVAWPVLIGLAVVAAIVSIPIVVPLVGWLFGLIVG